MAFERRGLVSIVCWASLIRKPETMTRKKLKTWCLNTRKSKWFVLIQSRRDNYGGKLVETSRSMTRWPLVLCRNCWHYVHVDCDRLSSMTITIPDIRKWFTKTAAYPRRGECARMSKVHSCLAVTWFLPTSGWYFGVCKVLMPYSRGILRNTNQN